MAINCPVHFPCKVKERFGVEDLTRRVRSLRLAYAVARMLQ